MQVTGAESASSGPTQVGTGMYRHDDKDTSARSPRAAEPRRETLLSDFTLTPISAAGAPRSRPRGLPSCRRRRGGTRAARRARAARHGDRARGRLTGLRIFRGLCALLPIGSIRLATLTASGGHARSVAEPSQGRRPVPFRTPAPLAVPTDVTDDQKYWYFGTQQRWFLVLRFSDLDRPAPQPEPVRARRPPRRRHGPAGAPDGGRVAAGLYASTRRRRGTQTRA